MMQVSVDVANWQLETDDEKKERKITGKFTVKTGQTLIAEQTFNSSYGGVKILFSAGLMAEIEKINATIVKEITENFVGK